MLILLALAVDFLVANMWQGWLLHCVVAYLLVLLALPEKEGAHVAISIASGAFLITDFAAHGLFGAGFLFLIPIILLLKRLKIILVHGSSWLVAIGFFCFFFYEGLLFPRGVTLLGILSNLIVGYLILLGLRGNRSSALRAHGGRKVWTPNRKDAS
jgi:hypothetical protein